LGGDSQKPPGKGEKTPREKGRWFFCTRKYVHSLKKEVHVLARKGRLFRVKTRGPTQERENLQVYGTFFSKKKSCLLRNYEAKKRRRGTFRGPV